MKVEVLYFDGCPSWREAWTVVGDALARARISAEVRLVNVEGMSDEALAGFAGSPTVRIDGRDLERFEGAPVHACRRYMTNDGRGWPAVDAVVAALEEAAAQDR